ncbi:MAG: NADH-quinone oxidoreductase subunit NuoN [Propionibacteriaceae bacterium]|jgi:NADH-quinone oxidoreductase subunit N|nr:NADH-quinone oxidoreductase subunit NuoN [Propionibacteriaceae bacterium]
MTLLEFTAPTLDYGLLAPFLIVIGAAAIGVLVEAFVDRTWRHEVQTGLAVLALLAAGTVTVVQWGEEGYGLADPVRSLAGSTGSVLIDGPTQVFWLMLLGFGLFGVLLFSERVAHEGHTAFTSAAAAIPGSRAESEAQAAHMGHAEVFPLALFSLSGMMLFVAADDTLTMFVALEIMSLPLYVLASLARHRRLASQEAALKYFLLGAAASAIFLFGVALLFAHAGTFDFAGLSQAVTGGLGQSRTLLLAGLALVAVGLLFKLGAVPFHNWAPDVYQGAPTPVAGFMAVCTKIAAVAGLLRLFYVGLGAELWWWRPLFIGVAVVTMVVGAVLGIVQSDVKRLLAYSSIAHAGFVLVGFVGALVFTTATVDADTGAITIAAGIGLGSVGAIATYLVAYGFATLAAFACVTLVRSQGREATGLAAWSGLGRRVPWFGATMLVALLSLAGIPLTAGFVGKFAVFQAAWRGGLWWLALIAVLAAVVAVYIYFRLVVVLFFRDPEPGVEVRVPGSATVTVLVLSTLGTLFVGLLPGPLTDALAKVTTFLVP